MSFRYVWVLLFLFILLLYIIFQLKKSTRPIFHNSSKKIRKIVENGISSPGIKLKNRFMLFGIFFLIISASGPQIGTKIRPIERKGIDLVIALDTSQSMDARDVTPSRLSKAKFELSKLIKNLKGDRISIIVFAGSSHLYLPLTTDYEAAVLFLNEIDTQMIPNQGTVLSSAIKTALNAFTSDMDKFKVMILVSDGEDHDGEAIKISERAANQGMMINTVGVGSEVGSLIPIENKSTNEVKYKRDRNGNLITSVLNDNILREIARVGSGLYFSFSNTSGSHKDIISAIESMEKKTISTHEYSEYEDRYQPIATIALFCFLMAFITSTKNKERA